ncbi:MAG TPA: hypothetical protein VF223_16790 [Trebonia sp.]
MLRAGNPDRHQWEPSPAWCHLQGELAAFSTFSAHTCALKAGHHMHLDDPAVVVQAIGDLVRQCRGA